MTIPEYIAWLEAGLKEAQRSHDLLGKANNNPVFSDNGKPWPSTGDNKNRRYYPSGKNDAVCSCRPDDRAVSYHSSAYRKCRPVCRSPICVGEFTT